jgi:hypothetical protein
MHETAYYFFCGDFVYCSALLEKNLPFFYRNSPEKGDDIRLVFLKLIRARISELEKNKPIPKKLLDQRNFFLESTYLLLWKRLIDRILGETE